MVPGGVSASVSPSISINDGAAAVAPAQRLETTTAPRASASGRIRAAFYYPWFPEAWAQHGIDPFTNYVPVRGSYGIDAATVRAQIAEMQYGDITLGLASWFGKGSLTERHWATMIGAAAGTGFAWAPYYEPEGTSDPSPAQLADDLHYLRSTYGGPGSSLAALPGQGMVVFVYNADDATSAQGCATVSRWKEAEALLQQQYGESVYVDLKVFPGYRTCADDAAIAGWHQYGPASASHDLSAAPGDGSYAVSPGFWKAGVPYRVAPFLVRDRVRWTGTIAAMNASGARWQLITTYNEWGEGTAIESASACRGAAPTGTMCDWSGGGVRSEFLTDLHDAPVP